MNKYRYFIYTTANTDPRYPQDLEEAGDVLRSILELCERGISPAGVEEYEQIVSFPASDAPFDEQFVLTGRSWGLVSWWEEMHDAG